MDAIRWAGMAALAILLSSCGIPQLRQPEPARELPPTFNGVTSSENSSQIGVVEFFNDPVLTDLIDQGLAGNQELKILAQEVQIANNAVLARSGAFLPFITAGGTARLDKYSLNTLQGADNVENTPANGSHFPVPLPNFLVSTDLSWQIDIWRQLRNARE